MNQQIEQKFTRRLAMSHRLISDEKSPCFNLHGHNIYIKWTASLLKNDYFDFDFNENMMAPFAKVKGTVHRWMDEHLDHANYVADKDPFLSMYIEHMQKIVIFPGDPTMETVSACILSKINAILSDSTALKIYCPEVEIEETPTNTVISRSTFNLSKSTEHWWNRSDMSTYDLAQIGTIQLIDSDPEAKE